MTARERRDDAVLAALAAACQDELGGWATPMPVAAHMGAGDDTGAIAGVSSTLARLARQGRVDVWTPRGGKTKVSYLYRPAL